MAQKSEARKGQGVGAIKKDVPPPPPEYLPHPAANTFNIKSSQETHSSCVCVFELLSSLRLGVQYFEGILRSRGHLHFICLINVAL